MEDLIAIEKAKRLDLWEKIKKFPEGKVPPRFLNSQFIYRGRAGTYADIPNTSSLTKDEGGVTISIQHRGNRYPASLRDDGVDLHYPDTNRKGDHDKNAIDATKNAQKLRLPIFVILSGITDFHRTVKLGWVMGSDDDEKFFKVKFSETDPVPPSTEGVDSFQLEDSGEVKIASARMRLRQSEFRSSLIEKYGLKCAVCNVRHPDLLDASHIRGKQDKGSDDWRNGLMLCKNHHSAFDKELFGINPESKKLVFLSKETAEEINISQKKLETETGEMPHEKALRWKWKRFQKVLKEANQ